METQDGNYDPYFVALKSRLPKFDERFRGYSLNKKSLNVELQYMKFDYIVLPHLFMMHRFHEHSETRIKQVESKDIVSNVYQSFLNELKSKYSN